MFAIQGSKGVAACYATNIEDGCIEQIKNMLDMEFASGVNIAIMPDAHFGIGCTIGTTMEIKDMVVPNLVGIDLGCGMLTANVGQANINLSNFDDACHLIPSGRNVWKQKKEAFDLTELRCYRNIKDTKRIEKSLGSLGSGNHFIEIDTSSGNGDSYIVIHSGSRNLGKQVAEFYQDIAVQLHSGKEEFLTRKEQMIKEYKAQGRKQKLHDSLKKLEQEYQAKEPDAPKDLCWLYGSFMDDYLHDVDVCQRFAKRNREVMLEEILRQTGLNATDAFHTVHNYIDVDEMILRKGAISAKKDETVLIPLNMRDGSILAKGKGNKDWNYSAPHGAGRVLSRKSARSTLDIDTYKEQMKGIYTTSVCNATLDEAPDAYKSIDDIIEPISEAVNVIDIMKPIYNFKAS